MLPSVSAVTSLGILGIFLKNVVSSSSSRSIDSPSDSNSILSFSLLISIFLKSESRFLIE